MTHAEDSQEPKKTKKRRLTGGMQQIADVYREGKELDKLFEETKNSQEHLPSESMLERIRQNLLKRLEQGKDGQERS